MKDTRYVSVRMSGLRIAEHPGIVFKDGPTGRRAALVLGPDVSEVVTVASEIEVQGEGAIPVIASTLNLTASRVELALRYYAVHAAEVDAEIADREAASRAAEAEWNARQRLLA